MSIMAPEAVTAADMEGWHDMTPGCEVMPNPDSDEPCGDPALGPVLCFIKHKRRCRKPRNERFILWLCAYHLQLAREGQARRRCCDSVVTVLQVL